MQTIGFTNTEQVRAILGITEEDFDDAQFLSRGLAKELNLDLSSWVPDLDAVVYGTDMQQDTLAMYSTYFCATLTAQSLRMAATQKTTDGQNALERFTNMDWRDLLDSLRERVAFYRKLLESTFDELPTPAPTLKVFTSVGLGIDPVLGIL